MGSPSSGIAAKDAVCALVGSVLESEADVAGTGLIGLSWMRDVHRGRASHIRSARCEVVRVVRAQDIRRLQSVD
ncbi:unnamed protein product [Ixodes pacificus]